MVCALKLGKVCGLIVGAFDFTNISCCWIGSRDFMSMSCDSDVMPDPKPSHQRGGKSNILFEVN